VRDHFGPPAANGVTITADSGQIDQIDQDINRLLRSSVWREQDALLQSAKGVGPILSASLLAQVPELGCLSHKEIASLVGVAPFDNDSGRYAGGRAIDGGRAGVRTVLYMATLSAIRHNPVIRSYHSQLRQRGKIAKVAIVACMRKNFPHPQRDDAGPAALGTRCWRPSSMMLNGAVSAML
jgi:transposase